MDRAKDSRVSRRETEKGYKSCVKSWEVKGRERENVDYISTTLPASISNNRWLFLSFKILYALATSKFLLEMFQCRQKERERESETERERKREKETSKSWRRP